MAGQCERQSERLVWRVTPKTRPYSAGAQRRLEIVPRTQRGADIHHFWLGENYAQFADEWTI